MSLLELVPPKGPSLVPFFEKVLALFESISIIFILNYCRLIDSPTSSISKTQATTTWFSSIISMPTSLGFLDFVFPYKCSNNEVRGTFQCLLAFLNEIVPFSIASMASSKASLVHLPLVIRGLHLLIFFCFLVGSCSKDGGTFSVATPFWPSVRMKLTLPKLGIWSPPGLPNF